MDSVLERLTKPLREQSSHGRLKRVVMKSSYSAKLNNAEGELEFAMTALGVSCSHRAICDIAY